LRKINKKGLIDATASKIGMKKQDIGKVLDGILETIGDTLANEEKIELWGFGTFEAKERKGRIGVNPQTKEPMKIEPTKNVSFKVGRSLKEKIRGEK